MIFNCRCKNYFLFVSLVVVMIFTLTACQDDPQGVGPESKSLPFKLKPSEKVDQYKRDDSGLGHVVIKGRGGSTTVVWVKDKNRYIPIPPATGIDIVPEEAARIGPLGGKLVDFEILEVPLSRLPASVFAPWPKPGTDGRMTDEDKRKYRMRVDLDDKEGKRVVVVTEEGIPPNLFIVIRIFDGNGKLIRKQRKTGKFKRAIFNEDTGEKTFLVESEGILQWIVLDIQDGSIVTDSRFGLQLDLPVVSIERVGNHVVVIQRWRNGGWIRVRIYSTDGQLQNVFDIPGSYVTSTTNGRDVKAIVFQDRDTVYQDMLKIETGSGGTFVRGLPQNGLAGKHKHLQYDKVNGKQRFVEVVYFKARDETTIRILDENGNLVGTIVAKGKYRHHLKYGNKKIFIIERDGFTDAYVINLETARQEQVTSRRGSFRRISVTSAGEATLITTRISVDFQIR